jgi:hypothetical protein
MAAGPKLVADRTEHRTEARRVPQALEPLQTSLTPADGLVRVLDAVVLAPAAEMGDGRHHDSRRVARQPIGHNGARHHPESLQELAKEALRGAGAPAMLNQDVENLARVIDGPPQCRFQKDGTLVFQNLSPLSCSFARTRRERVLLSDRKSSPSLRDWHGSVSRSVFFVFCSS